MTYSKGLLIYRYEDTLKRLREGAKESLDKSNYLEYFLGLSDFLKARPSILKACKSVRNIYHYAVDPYSEEVPEEDRGLYYIADYVGLSVAEAKRSGSKVAAAISKRMGKRLYLSRVMTREPLDMVVLFYAAEGSGAPVVKEIKPLAFDGCTKAESWELEVIGL